MDCKWLQAQMRNKVQHKVQYIKVIFDYFKVTGERQQNPQKTLSAQYLQAQPGKISVFLLFENHGFLRSQVLNYGVAGAVILQKA